MQGKQYKDVQANEQAALHDKEQEDAMRMHGGGGQANLQMVSMTPVDRMNATDPGGMARQQPPRSNAAWGSRGNLTPMQPPHHVGNQQARFVPLRSQARDGKGNQLIV